MAWAFEESVAAYAESAEWWVRRVEQVGDAWDAPALGEWDVRALVGHTLRAFLTVEEYLARPADRVAVGSAAGYYRATRELARSPEVARRGQEAGAALGDDPVDAVATVVHRVLDGLDGHDGTALLTTVAGGMRLADYLPTRTFEVVVHGLDLAAALRLPLDVPPAGARQASSLITEVAIRDGSAGPLLLAATGRRALSDGFSVL